MASPAIYHGSNTALSLSSITRLLDDHYKGNLKLPPETRDQLLSDQEELTGYSRYIANSY